MKLLVIDAKEKRVLVLENGIWMFGDTMVGVNDDAVILYLKNPDNKALLDNIKALTYPEFASKAIKNKKE
ncbi:MAG: hypothetical protein IIX03_05415 [Paludibacteraceae bacterium]|nr:hypothetical protein [Paludibacteraceae bacterium]